MNLGSFALILVGVMSDKELVVKDCFYKHIPDGSLSLLRYFLTWGEIMNFRLGDQILKKGDPSDTFYWLIRGGVKSYRNGELILQKDGDFLGLQSAIQGLRILYDYNCITDHVVVLKLPTIRLFDLLSEEPQAIFPIMQIIFKKAELLENNGVQIMQADSEGKLLQVLRYLIHKFGISEDSSIPVELNSDDLALLSGSSRTSTYRWLKSFEDKGLIKRSGNRIKLLNKKIFQKTSV